MTTYSGIGEKNFPKPMTIRKLRRVKNERNIIQRSDAKKRRKSWLDGSPVDSKWVYGNGVLQGKGDFSMIYQNEPKFDKHTVYTDTIGQYTGLTDKNGNKIFEGDIVRINRFNYEYVGEVIYNNKTSGFEVRYFNKVGGYGERAMHTVLICKTFWAEVIGNIHDNPELLEQEG